MKLKFTYDSYHELWYCFLPVGYTSWQASGKTPNEAFELYLIKVKAYKDENGIDYVWCKQKGLIK